ncbi:RING finger protein 160 [Trichuris trichiura]|uniref:E3 ubiquitin-protein ligase listerin n=1 Tax=Trichuris trichiura TaxID=36087 RepID=A0A077Z8L7_TRITR|nr:RING finger protein 160 [Trichuris trichiura]
MKTLIAFAGQVSIYSGIREIIAAYVKEELRLELVIKIPEGYPLAVLSAEMTKQVVGFKKDGWTTPRWTPFIFVSFVKSLLQTNGLVNCVLFWKINVESFLEGVEPCCICMMIVNNLNNFDNEIPRKTCRQCKHKFHSLCLRKWFRSATSTTCPMCRANFYLN